MAIVADKSGNAPNIGGGVDASAEGVVVLGKNLLAGTTTAAFHLAGGYISISRTGTFGGASVSIEVQAPNGSWNVLLSGVTAATVNWNTATLSGKHRVVVTGGDATTRIDVLAQRIGYLQA